jgi:hypothetical protein
MLSFAGIVVVWVVCILVSTGSNVISIPVANSLFKPVLVAELVENENTLNATRTESPQYVFGVSTGHAGSTTAHAILGNASSCPGPINAQFEIKGPKESEQEFEAEEDLCKYTRKTLLPFFETKRPHMGTYMDLGHFHNRGPVLECMAKLLDKATFVLLRRNRHDIAISFSKQFSTPCLNAEPKMRHPAISYCPHSEERNGPVGLAVEDEVWTQLSSFQKFLWMADEMEHRFYKLQQAFSSPNYLEISWSSSKELSTGLADVRVSLGCSREFEMTNKKSHVKHEAGRRNCTKQVLEDLAYRQLVNYTLEKQAVVFAHPQRVTVEECMETEEEVRTVIRSALQSITHWEVV